MGTPESDPPTGELMAEQERRQSTEEELAKSAADEQEAAQHERRAEKAHYLREKLEERADSERDAGGEG